MENVMESIIWEGHTYWYEHKVARHRIDKCLATRDPKKYCNGFYLYSDKDPGSGKCFVIVKTDNPDLFIPDPEIDNRDDKPWSMW